MATTMSELKKHRMLAGGQWVEPASGRVARIGESVYRRNRGRSSRAGTKADVDRAVAAAKSAFYDGDWRKLTATRARRTAAPARAIS